MKHPRPQISAVCCLLFVAAAAAVAFGEAVQGSGVVQHQTRAVGDFTRLRVSGSIDIEFSRARKTSVVVEADDNIIPLIDTLVHGDELEIKSHQPYSSKHAVRVILTAPTLGRIQISGSGNADLRDIAADRFVASVSGSGDLRAAGAVKQITVDLSGSGNITMSKLKSADATVSLSGSGNVDVNASASLDATIAGSGNVRCSGNPGTVHKDVTGSGRVQVN